jgi:hypothetical protein
MTDKYPTLDEYIGYKTIEKIDNRIVTPYYDYPIELNKWLIDKTEKTIGTKLMGSQSYQAGFHIWAKIEGAMANKQFLKENACNRTQHIYKVKYRKIIADGAQAAGATDYIFHRCFVAKEMMVLCEVDNKGNEKIKKENKDKRENQSKE